LAILDFRLVDLGALVRGGGACWPLEETQEAAVERLLSRSVAV